MTEENFYIKKGKEFIKLSKSVKTRYGDYVIPLPDLLKIIGGVDFHLSDHGGGYQHFKSRKLGIQKDFVTLIKESIKEENKSNLPDYIEVILIKSKELTELMSIKEDNKRRYIDGDLIEKTLNNQPKINLGKIKKLSKKLIGLFSHHALSYILIRDKLYSFNPSL